MKKILLLLVSVALVFSFVGCKDEMMEVSIEDNNSDSQYNYDLEGVTLTLTKPAQTMTKTVTSTGGSTEKSDIVLANYVYSITFGEMNDDGVGTLNMSRSKVATAAADADYVTTVANTAFQFTMNNDGFTGKTVGTRSYAGTYSAIEGENEQVVFVIDGLVRTDSTKYSGDVPTTTSTTYSTSEPTATVVTPVNSVENLVPHNDYYVYEGDDSTKIRFSFNVISGFDETFLVKAEE